MTTTYRHTRAGRIILEKDGYDSKWNAMMQGSRTGKVSLASDYVEIYTGSDGEVCASWSDGYSAESGTLSECFAAAVDKRIKDAIILKTGKVQ